MTTMHLSGAELMTSDQRDRPRSDLFAMAFLTRYRVAKTRDTYQIALRQWFEFPAYNEWAGRCANSPGPGPNLYGGPNMQEPTRLPAPDRFWSQVGRCGDDDCWLWTGGLNSAGYPRFSRWYAHRLAYSITVGPIPEGLTIDHLCGVARCVNPRHLEPVTQAENHRRWVATLTVCPHGHEKSPENTYVSAAGHRYCRECRRVNQRRYTARKRGAL